jgi:hypothetical protein
MRFAPQWSARFSGAHSKRLPECTEKPPEKQLGLHQNYQGFLPSPCVT